MNMTFGNLTYVVYMVVFSWLPVFILWIKYYKYSRKNFSIIMKAFAFTFPIVLIWHVISIYDGVWAYSSDKILNIYLSFVPLEEVLLVASAILGISSITILFYEYLHKHKKIK